MIFGIGCDISKVARFEKWLEKDGEMISRFFNEKEILYPGSKINDSKKSRILQHYAARFSAKEAFSKALGTGIDFPLNEVYIENNAKGKPVLKVEGKAKEKLEKLTECSIEKINILVTLSHEKEYAVAMVVIEI